ncbi:MAG: RsmB/NOP family class I SAM-dependent RNA methyltransferase [Bacteroidetes bacterium]|nr:RsmB/NOP family class I SAM-dependent RNA methyltransferase [Bacteroidota bacterium]
MDKLRANLIRPVLVPLPELFVERLRSIVPPERFDGVLGSFSAPQAVGFRINRLKGSEDAALDELRSVGLSPEAVSPVPGAFAVPAEQRPQLLNSEPASRDAIYIQNVSSQLPPLILDPQPGERVLDLCAAPGSKTRQLACLMQDEGEIVAVEKVRKRFYKLKANVARQGSTIVRPVLGSGTAYWHREPEAFDRVMVDAPCSTEGRFRTDDPETTRYWSRRKIKEMQAKQRRLLFAGIQALKPGGTLVYSTCTFAPEENEAVLHKALRTFGDAVELVDARLDDLVGDAAQPGLLGWNDRVFNPHVSKARRVLPDGTFEAFFVACFTKHESTMRS